MAEVALGLEAGHAALGLTIITRAHLNLGAQLARDLRQLLAGPLARYLTRYLTFYLTLSNSISFDFL